MLPDVRGLTSTQRITEFTEAMLLNHIIKGRGAFPHDRALERLRYLGLRNAPKKWTMPIRDWKAALNQFFILFGDAVPV